MVRTKPSVVYHGMSQVVEDDRERRIRRNAKRGLLLPIIFIGLLTLYVGYMALEDATNGCSTSIDLEGGYYIIRNIGCHRECEASLCFKDDDCGNCDRSNPCWPIVIESMVDGPNGCEVNYRRGTK